MQTAYAVQPVVSHCKASMRLSNMVCMPARRAGVCVNISGWPGVKAVADTGTLADSKTG